MSNPTVLLLCVEFHIGLVHMADTTYSYSVLVWLQLYNVVVETEQVGKKLLEKGELKRRVTIIPLNKIAATTISGDAVKRAESLVSN